MKALVISFAILAGGVLSAQAQSSRAYVAAEGSGSECTVAAPCGRIFDAFNQLPYGGTAHLLTNGAFGNIAYGDPQNKHLEGAGAGSTIDSVSYSGEAKNIVIKNLGVSGIFLTNAMQFVASGGSLTVEDVTFSNHTAANAAGVNFAPAGDASLTLRNVKLTGASAGTGAAIRIVTNGRTVNVSLDNVQVSGGIRGISVDSTGGGFARISIKNSTFSNISGPAILATAGSGKIRLYIDDVTTVNSGVGISANGSNVIGWIGETTIAGNNIGIQRTGNANLMSFKNNYVYNNNTDGTPLPQTWAPPAAAGPAPSSPAPSSPVPALDPKSAFMASDD